VLLAAGGGYALWLAWTDPAWSDALRGDIPTTIQVLPLAAALLIRVATSVPTAWAWLTIVRSLGGVLDFRDGFRIHAVTGVAKYLPGKLLVVAGRVALLQERGQPVSVGLTSVLIELTVSLVAAGIVLAVCLPLLFWNSGTVEHASTIAWVTLAVVPIGLVGLHPRVLGPILAIGSRLLPRSAAMSALLPPPFRATLLAVGGYLLSRIGATVALYGAALSVIPLDAGSLPFLAAASAAAYLIGVAAPTTVAGFGVRDGLMLLLLSAILPVPVAAEVIVIDRSISILSEIVAAGLALALARWPSRETGVPVSSRASVPPPTLPTL
jgi:uncharacterized membrane protein YbhN (UPF0104 family)